MNATFKTVMLWMSLLVVVFLAWHFAQFQKRETPMKFSEFMAQVEAGQVQDVTVTGNEIKGHTVSREAFRSFGPGGTYDKLVDRLLAKGVVVTYQPDTTPTWANMLISWAPFLLLIGFWVFPSTRRRGPSPSCSPSTTSCRSSSTRSGRSWARSTRPSGSSTPMA